MSEQPPNPIPDSIPNKYALQEQPSGLLVADSRANHSYSEHPHPVNDEGPTEHVKTRGIVYNETELGGKPFIIAERPRPDASQASETDTNDGAEQAGSNSHAGDSQPENEGDNNQDDGSGEYEFPAHTPVQYRAREDGKVQLGVEIDEPGTTIELSKHEKTRDPNDRRVIITDKEGNEFYVRGQHLYQITDDGDGGNWKIADHRYIGNAPLSDLTVGESWEQPFANGEHGRKTAFPINSVEVPTELADENTNLEAFEATGLDPFERAEMLISELKGQLKHDRIEKTSEINGRRRIRIPGRSQTGRERDESRGGNGERHRLHNRILGFLGVVALAGVMGFGAAEFIHQDQQQNDRSKPVPHRTAKAGHRHGHAAQREETLQAGQNPWTVSEHQLQAHGVGHPSNAQIEDYDQRMAQINSDIYHYYGNSSEEIPVGTQLKLPNT